MFTWRFWRETLERAIKTAAQAAILRLSGGAIGGVQQGGFDLFAIQWEAVLGYAAGGLAVSIMTSLMTVNIGADDSPSAIK